MQTDEIRKKFLSFFENKEHKIVPSSSLIPEDDSVLFTTAGMQQFKDYYLDKESPYGSRVTAAQKCFRTSDIEEVGDQDHLTFFEMMGNFSFDDYFKQEAIDWAQEFLIQELGLEREKLAYTYFAGNEDIPKDKKSKNILVDSGIPEKRIYALGQEENFWGPTGQEGPCGPTVEIHYILEDQGCDTDCDPSCDCGKYVEIWNLVFNQFYMDQSKNLEPLDDQGIDTGMGLERVAMITQDKPHVFKTDLFQPLLDTIDEIKEIDSQSKRIIADHIKGAVFLISEGVEPSNTERGYILRRVLRKAIRLQKLKDFPAQGLSRVAEAIFSIYDNVYLEDTSKEEVMAVVNKEKKKFEKALKRGMKEFEKKTEDGQLDGETAFHLYSTYGFPLEMIEQVCQERDIDFEKDGFEEAKKAHQEASRKGAEEKFGGLSKDPEKEEEKLHTATHLLHESLRKVLGDHVEQKGSDINPKRLRFDFSHSEQLTEDEISAVEKMVNEAIKKNMKVQVEEMSYEEAIEEGAVAVFEKDRYPDIVKVYSIVDESGETFSKELCGGPHVSNTSQLGEFKITKEKSSSRGVRRIKAVLQ